MITWIDAIYIYARAKTVRDRELADKDHIKVRIMDSGLWNYYGSDIIVFAFDVIKNIKYWKWYHQVTFVYNVTPTYVLWFYCRSDITFQRIPLSQGYL